MCMCSIGFTCPNLALSSKKDQWIPSNLVNRHKWQKDPSIKPDDIVEVDKYLNNTLLISTVMVAVGLSLAYMCMGNASPPGPGPRE